IDPQISENDLTVSANGGTEVFQYSIDGGLTFQSDSVFTDLPNGDYTIVVMDENGCTASSMININFTSTHEAGSGLVFEVRPNPGTDIFHLTLPTHLAEGLTIEIFSAIGQLVYTEQMRLPDPFDKTLNLGDLPAGHYQLRLMSGQRWGVKRLVVVK
ncbi:MAG TPA: T9SS type A sorting domain-containing protein, partial [Bacteroidetes bacterium]|nr:T9SS type A sorting domain-containing protein [Bacteroidota bacterium]